MPNRILKESICTSEEIDALTVDQEVFFYRLMVVCDDYGLMDARPAILKARCYPLKSIDIKRIQVMLDALNTVELIRLYQVEGKPYLHIAKWERHQSIRAKKPKFPQPQADDFRCKQVHADVPVIQSNPIQSESNPIQSKQRDKPADLVEMVLPMGLKASKWDEWFAYRSKIGKRPKDATWAKQIEFLAACAEKGFDPGAIIDESIRNGWQGLFEPKHQQKNSKAPTYHDSLVGAGKAIFGDLSNGKQQRTENIIDIEPLRIAAG